MNARPSSFDRSGLATALVAGLAVLFAARLGLSVTVAPAAGAGVAGAAQPAATSVATAQAAATPVATPQDAPGANPSRQGTRYYVDGRYLVREMAGSVPAGAVRVRVDTHMGAIRLHPSAGADLGYRVVIRAVGPDTAETRRRIDRMTVSASRTGDLLQFSGTLPDPSGPLRGLGVEFDLAVPATVRGVQVATGGGDIEAKGAPGAIDLLTRGGTVSADDLEGPLTAETRGGRIDLGQVRAAAQLITSGGDVTVGGADGILLVRTSGGDVRIGRAGSDVRVETGGGSVLIEKSGGAVRVATSGGDIEVGEAQGEVVAATMGGGIRVGRAGGGVRCETAAGAIVLDGVGGAVKAISSAGSIRALLGGRAVPADSDIQTWQGDVVVSLPEDLPVTVRALVDNPVGQPIQSDFPLTILRDLDGTGRPLEIREARIGGGGPVLKLRTLNGRIVILKVKNGRESKPAEAAQQH